MDTPPPELDLYEGIERCDVCGLEACELHGVPPPRDAPTTETPKTQPTTRGLDPAFLQDAVTVIAEGQRIAATGIRYLVDGIVPAYGMLGMLVAFAKVGKTTLGQALAAAVAMGEPFLDRPTTPTRVLVVAAEDPPEYTAYLARSLTVTEQRLTFYRAPVLLNAPGLQQLIETVEDGHYGLVLIASWQAVIRGLVKDENDNAGAVNIVETVKAATRATGIPWLIDAHSGKGENQEDDADPTMAMRGASGAAGAADYTLSLRYANGAFGTQRRLSGKGRFVNLAPLTLEYTLATGVYTSLGTTKDAAKETTWRLIREMGAIDQTPRSLTEIARRCGLIAETERLGGNHRKQMVSAIAGHDEIGKLEEMRRGQKATLYRLLDVM
jgi:hypothetical protein